MQEQEQIRFGVLGTGVIVRDYHLPALVNNPRARLAALGNQRASSLERLAKRQGIAKTYTDFEQMAGDEEIDAVIIGLPNYLHAPVSIQMLEAGKHVLCEKPMAMSVREAEAMAEAALNANRVLMIGHMWRYDREISWLRTVMDSGFLGTVFKIKAHSVSTDPNLPGRKSWFLDKRFAGGGAFADMGVHAVDLVSFLFHDRIKPISVYATGGNYFQEAEVEDTASAMIEYDNGVSAVVETGWFHNHFDGPEGSVQVFGTEGYARTFPSELRCRVAGEWGGFTPVMPPRARQCDLPMYEAQLNRFIDCVNGTARPEPDAAQGRRSMVILEAAYRSMKSGSSMIVEGY
jgi:predicted dehydrogenase